MLFELRNIAIPTSEITAPVGTLIAESDTDTVDGTWEVIGADTVLVLNFGGDIPFDELEDDWDVFSVEADRVELRDISGGDGELDVLVFEKL